MTSHDNLIGIAMDFVDEQAIVILRLKDELEEALAERDKSIDVCRLILRADKENKTGYPTTITPDMILASRSVVKGWEVMP
jgi:hypothetical protein